MKRSKGLIIVAGFLLLNAVGYAVYRLGQPPPAPPTAGAPREVVVPAVDPQPWLEARRAGVAALSRNQTLEAERRFEEAIRLGDSSEEVVRLLGVAREMAGNTPSAGRGGTPAGAIAVASDPPSGASPSRPHQRFGRDRDRRDPGASVEPAPEPVAPPPVVVAPPPTPATPPPPVQPTPPPARPTPAVAPPAPTPTRPATQPDPPRQQPVRPALPPPVATGGVGDLEVLASGEIWINGRARGTGSRVIRGLPAGRVIVELRDGTRILRARAVTVRANERTIVNLR